MVCCESASVTTIAPSYDKWGPFLATKSQIVVDRQPISFYEHDMRCTRVFDDTTGHSNSPSPVSGRLSTQLG